MLIFSLKFSNTQHTTFLHVYTSYTHVYTCKIHNFHTTFCPLCISLTFFIGPKFIKNQAFILSPRIGLFTVFLTCISSHCQRPVREQLLHTKNEKQATTLCENMCKTPQKGQIYRIFSKNTQLLHTYLKSCVHKQHTCSHKSIFEFPIHIHIHNTCKSYVMYVCSTVYRIIRVGD